MITVKSRNDYCSSFGGIFRKDQSAKAHSTLVFDRFEGDVGLVPNIQNHLRVERALSLRNVLVSLAGMGSTKISLRPQSIICLIENVCSRYPGQLGERCEAAISLISEALSKQNRELHHFRFYFS